MLKHNNLMLKCERRERLEAWAASDSPISHSQYLGPWLTATTGKLDQQQLLPLHTCLEAPEADVRVVVPARRRYRARV